eukprot:scaffold36306_cov73-Cyclotella_meneghiniana.AAC.5
MSGHHRGCAQSKEYLLPVPELPVILVADVAHDGRHEEEKLTGLVLVVGDGSSKTQAAIIHSFIHSFLRWVCSRDRDTT